MTDDETGGPGRRAFIGLLAAGLAVGAGTGYALRDQGHAATPADNSTLYFASGFGVHALHAATGAVRWFRPLSTSGPVAIAGGAVYAADYRGHVHALDAGSGRAKWVHLIGDKALYPSLSAAGGRIYVMGGDGYTYALDAATGRALWRQPTGSTQNPPYAYQDLVFAGNPDSELVALDAATGAVRWRNGRPDQETGEGTLRVVHGTLYATGTSTSAVIDPRTGHVLSEFSGQLLATANGTGYFTDVNGASLQARNLATRKPAWTVRPPGAEFSQVTLGGGVLYAGVSNNEGYLCCTRANRISLGWAGFISAYSAAAGRRRWSHPAPEGYFSAPLLVADVLYVAGLFNVYALHAGTGTVLWVVSATEQIFAANLVMGAPRTQV
jgi:outer membrane protein assembly factor BamB